ncbi:MAG: hypothetical protein ACO1RA_04475 [Planctomycetaceae bacterium]
MKAICIIDTSVFVEFLNVSSMNSRYGEVTQEVERKIRGNESLFLPMATIFETGNHIAQNGDGNQRRKCAERFVKQVSLAIDGKIPFTPINFVEAKDLRNWLEEFPDWAMREEGLGDLSIKRDWERLCEQHPARRVYIWSFDGHLSSFDRQSM